MWTCTCFKRFHTTGIGSRWMKRKTTIAWARISHLKSLYLQQYWCLQKVWLDIGCWDQTSPPSPRKAQRGCMWHGVCVCVFVCVCVHAHVCVCVCRHPTLPPKSTERVHVAWCVCAHACACMRACEWVCVCVCVCMHACVCVLHMVDASTASSSSTDGHVSDWFPWIFFATL